MSGLFLWTLSVATAAVALAIMIGLVIARTAVTWSRSGREAERRRLVPVLLAGAAGTDRRARDRPLLTDITVELIRLVRGSERDRLIDAASRLGVAARLQRRLDSGSPRVRIAAVEALSEFPDEESTDRLLTALSDRSADVRLSAALALAARDRAPSAVTLVDLLGIGTTEHSLLVRALFSDIARTRPDEIKALILSGGVPVGAKAAAVDALSASGDYSLVPMVARLVCETPTGDSIVARYLHALGEFGHPAAAEAVKRGLSSWDADVRAAACEAAGRIGLAELADELEGCLADLSFDVRLRAGEALVRLGEEGVARLRATSRAGGEAARHAAASILAERGLA
ncbi:HEAT repeat domain-containing protein [Sphingomonas parva]|uniref:HEAT repeat domain-containing protein n=1 Tax=Sphingomonas parva TaxID=2555898 RepID=A0A4Y8ZTA7_9SPHN|nr:HEAT repeat domain-containing protein [Sphingomonas parva]TFI59258.1 HEAT repeat domain-containing protein [Sphingomonas parva]